MSDLETQTADNDMSVKAPLSSDSRAVTNCDITAFTRFVNLFFMLYLISNVNIVNIGPLFNLTLKDKSLYKRLRFLLRKPPMDGMVVRNTQFMFFFVKLNNTTFVKN